MNGLILFSVGSPQTRVNFNKSILNGYKMDEVSQFIDEDLLKGIDIQNNHLYFWGCKSSKYYERKIPKVNRGDTIAFSVKKEFIVKGKIIAVANNKALSKFLWGDEQYSHILIISDIEKISLPYSVLFNEIGYSPIAKITGLVLVDNAKLKHLNAEYRSVDEYLKKYIV